MKNVELIGDGPFLLVMQDPHSPGGFLMRRFPTKREALVVACNYTGSQREWLFEIAETFDMDAEHDAFWDSIPVT